MTYRNSSDGSVIEKLLEDYQLYARAAGFSNSQINNVPMCLRLFDRFFGGIRDIRDVTAVDFRRFLADLRTRPAWQGLNTEKQRHLSNATINTYARTVKTFFNWLKDQGYITESVLTSVPTPPVGKRVSKAYSEDQIRVVLDSADSLNTRNKAIVFAQIDSGLRINELSTLKIGDVNLKEGYAKVIGKGKGKKERYIYLGSYAVEAIYNYIQESRRDASDDEFLFVKNNGKHLTNSGIRSILVRFGESLGLEKRLSSHRLRHTFATLSHRYGATREELQKELGHSNPETTEGYLHVPDSDISAAHQRFSPLTNLIRGKTEKDSPKLNKAILSGQPQIDQKQTPQSRHSNMTDEQIRNSAEGLRNAIRLPWIKDSFIPVLQPGRHTLGKERFPINITQEGRIQITFSISSTGEKDLITQALCSHLETGSFADLFSRVSKWSNDVAEYLVSCHTLLNEVRSDIEGKYGISIPVDDIKPGFAIDFPILICADAVDQAGGFEHLKSYSYGKDGSNLKYGAYIIYYGMLNEDLRSQEELHRNLRIKWAKKEQTKLIATRNQELEDEALTINRQLQKFLAFPNLPGHCALCSDNIGTSDDNFVDVNEE